MKMLREVRVAAVDLGASSGRVIAGHYSHHGFALREVHRFPNVPVRVAGVLRWDVLGLFHGVMEGLRRAEQELGWLDSIGIDGWGVDYGILDEDGQLLGNPAHYRDSRTARAVTDVLDLAGSERLYAATGTQLQPFSTLFQLYADRGRAQFAVAKAALHGADGTRLGDSYRLITTLLDWRRYPAGELVGLCHERWEIEVACLALRHSLLGGYVLRSRDRAGAEQELWALLTVYQALRMAMTAATGSVPGTDPDRASFTVALEAAREQVTSARGIGIPADPNDTGRIGRAVLAGLLPARRARYSARKVKCSTSRYHLRDQDRPELAPPITRVLVTIFAPPPDRPAALPRGRRDQPPGPRPPRPDTRRDQVTRIMAGQPGHDWAGRDLAAMLAIKPRNMLTQLAEWTRLGFLAKTGKGRYALPERVTGLVTASASP
jgi:hypothetical protein